MILPVDAPTPPIASLGFPSALPVADVDLRSIPSAPGAYTIWDNSGRLLYAGLAGVRWTVARPSRSGTLRRRLGDHLNALRADVLTSYLFERVVAPTMDPALLGCLGEGTLTIRDLVREYLQREGRVAWAVTPDYATAKLTEDAIRGGALGQHPLINPAR